MFSSVPFQLQLGEDATGPAGLCHPKLGCSSSLNGHAAVSFSTLNHLHTA